MRKNTLIKLLAVFAMCFLIGAALVACGEAETDADVKGISSVAFDNDGNLVVTYTDNSTQTVELPAAADCEHLNLANYVLEEHTQTANGVTLLVCDDCGWAKLDYNQDHVWADGTVTVDPTCTEDGYTTAQYCTVCGLASEKTDIQAATGHTYGEWGDFIVNDGENLCEDGGVRYRYCEDCDAYETDTAASVVVDTNNPVDVFDGQHTVTDWATINAPTLDAAGKVSGVCDNCGKVVELDVPALVEDKDGEEVTNSAYTKKIEVYKEHCSDEGKDSYTHNATGEVYYVTRPGTTHGLKNADGDFVEIHSALPTLAATIEKGWIYSVDEWTAIEEFIGNHINSCKNEEATLAYYICEGVNDYGEQCCGVVDVYAVRGHVYETKLTGADNYKEETCTENGFQNWQCTSCDKVYTEVLKATGHDYTYAYEYGTNNQYGNLTWDAEKNNYFYYGTCGNECGVPDKQYVKNFSDTEVISKVDCVNPGQYKVTYTTHDDKPVEGVKTVAPTGHAIKVGDKEVVIVGGSEDQTLQEATVYYYYDFIGAENDATDDIIIIFTGKEVGTEPAPVGYFECIHTANHEGGPTKVLVWVSTDEAYKDNTPAELVQDDAQ
ncbi:MAG: hypothetical protein IJX92_01150 [Clostridia bacterium]|nr:hypothetical protein [Clostridia bacterium]